MLSVPSTGFSSHPSGAQKIQILLRGAIQKPPRAFGARVFSFCSLSKASFARSQNEKTSSMKSRRFLCPGLDSFHSGLQYLVSFVCQICVMNLNGKKMVCLIFTSSHFFSFSRQRYILFG